MFKLKLPPSIPPPQSQIWMKAHGFPPQVQGKPLQAGTQDRLTQENHRGQGPREGGRTQTVKVRPCARSVKCVVRTVGEYLTLHVDLMDGLGTGPPKHVYQPRCVDHHMSSSRSRCHLVSLGHIPLDGSHLHCPWYGVGAARSNVRAGVTSQLLGSAYTLGNHMFPV